MHSIATRACARAMIKIDRRVALVDPKRVFDDCDSLAIEDYRAKGEQTRFSEEGWGVGGVSLTETRGGAIALTAIRHWPIPDTRNYPRHRSCALNRSRN